MRPNFAPQTAYIHPRIGTGVVRYFDWLGAAMYNADRHSGSMHGKQFLLDAVYAGIDGVNLYGRLDFHEIAQEPIQLIVNLEVHERDHRKVANWRLVADIDKQLQHWELREANSEVVAANSEARKELQVALRRSFEFQIPIAELRAESGSAFHLRFSIWREGLPIDALPLEGAVVVPVITEEEIGGEL